jgi:hypothetical protein
VTRPRYAPVCLECDPDGHEDGKKFAASRWKFGARNTIRSHAERSHGGDVPEFEVMEVGDDA